MQVMQCSSIKDPFKKMMFGIVALRIYEPIAIFLDNQLALSYGYG